MKTAKLKRARTIAAVITELDTERCNRVYTCCHPFATGAEWIAGHIRKNYFAELKACTVEEALRHAKRRVVSANGGTAAQWRAMYAVKPQKAV